jgi:hypothetical protein
MNTESGEDGYAELDMGWAEYKARCQMFREKVYEHDPGHRATAPFMRYPGMGNRAQRRALRATAKRNR